MSTAVITGASSGIGESTARLLLQQGWAVHGWDISRPRLEGVTWSVVDVSDPGSVSAAAVQVTAVDLVVNAAGIADRAPAAEMRVEQWRRVIDINLSGTFYCAQALFPRSWRRRGSWSTLHPSPVIGHSRGAPTTAPPRPRS